MLRIFVCHLYVLFCKVFLQIVCCLFFFNLVTCLLIIYFGYNYFVRYILSQAVSCIFMYSIWFVKRCIFKVHLIFLFVLWVVLLFPKKNGLLQIHENFHLYLLPEVQFLYLSVIIFQLIFVYIIRKDFKFLIFPKGYLIVLVPLVGQSIWIKITIEFSR